MPRYRGACQSVLVFMLFLMIAASLPALDTPRDASASSPCENCVSATFSTAFRIDNVKGQPYLFILHTVRSATISNPNAVKVNSTLMADDLYLDLGPQFSQSDGATMNNTSGTTYHAIQKGSGYTNPAVNFELAPHSNLTFSLFIDWKTSFCRFNALDVSFGFSLDPAFAPGPIHIPLQSPMIISLPPEYTVLGYSSGGNMVPSAGRVLVEWGPSAGTSNFSIEFLPFHTSNTDKSFWTSVLYPKEHNSTFVLSEVYPNVGFYTVITESVVDIPLEIGGVKLNFTLPVSTTIDPGSFAVDSVSDAVGPLTHLSGSIGQGLIAPTGFYYVNYTSHSILSYPRTIARSGYYEIDLKLVWRVNDSTISKPSGLYTDISNVFLTSHPIPELAEGQTQTVITKIVLPSGVSLIKSNLVPANGIVGIEPDGRESVTWIEDVGAGTVTTLSMFSVSYDFTPLKTAFFLGLIFMLGEGIWMLLGRLRTLAKDSRQNLLGFVGTAYLAAVVTTWGISVALSPIVLIEEVLILVLALVGATYAGKRSGKRWK